jgi:hypothetical protein
MLTTQPITSIPTRHINTAHDADTGQALIVLNVGTTVDPSTDAGSGRLAVPAAEVLTGSIHTPGGYLKSPHIRATIRICHSQHTRIPSTLTRSTEPKNLCCR